MYCCSSHIVVIYNLRGTYYEYRVITLMFNVKTISESEYIKDGWNLTVYLEEV